MEEKKANDLINYIFEDYLKKSGYKDTLFTFYKETNKNIDEINNKDLENSIYTSLNLNKNESESSIIYQIIKKNYNESFLNEFYTNSMKFEESFIKKIDELNITNNEFPNIIKDMNETKYLNKKNSKEYYIDSIKNEENQNQNNSIKKDENQNDSIKNEKQNDNNNNESFDQKKNINSISFEIHNKKIRKNNKSKEKLNITSLKTKTINESFKSPKSFSNNNNSYIQNDIKLNFKTMKNLIKNYQTFVNDTESKTKKILKSKYKTKKIKNINKTVINKKESIDFDDITQTVVKKNPSKSNSSVLSKYLYFLYYEKYQLFKEENTKEIIKFKLKCSICQKNIKNKIFCFINKDPEINNVNNDYYICNKCFRETISETNSNLLSKFFMDFKQEEMKTNDYDIFIDFQKLTLNGQEIKSNGEINLYHMYCQKEYEFVLQFKYINCSNGEIKQLYLHKNDGSDIVPVSNFKQNQSILIKFKFKKLDKNYIGRFKKQIFFKSKDKKESEKFTFFINIIKIPNVDNDIENDETLDKTDNNNNNNNNYSEDNNSKSISSNKKNKIDDDDDNDNDINDKPIDNESDNDNDYNKENNNEESNDDDNSDNKSDEKNNDDEDEDEED